MLDTLFMKILDMTVRGSIVILVVLAVRLLLRKVPKIFSYALWAVVLFRLLCPVSISLPIGIVPEIAPISQQYTLTDETASAENAGTVPYLFTEDVISGNSELQLIPTEAAPPAATVNLREACILLVKYLWVFGVLAFAVYSLVAWLQFRRKLVGAVCIRENIYLADNIDTAFVFGLLHPRIYLPSALRETERGYVIAHEQHHIRRLDHLTKALAFLALGLHWFNPFVWLAYVLACRDMEMSCDEAVVKKLGLEIRGDYAQSLLNLSQGRSLGVLPLAFGEEDTKGRIRNLSQYKKPALWASVITAVLLAVTAFLLLGEYDPVDERLSVFIDCQIAKRYQTEETQDRASCVDWRYLGKRRNGKETTVFFWMLYEEYAIENDCLQEKTGSHIPTAITVRREGKDYKLVEYWEPRDGAYNPVDIREKFPWYLWGRAMDSQRYYPSQHENCLEMAREYFVAEASAQPGGTSAEEAFGAALSYAGYTAEAEFIAACRNALSLAKSNVRHLPVYTFATREELDQFTQTYGKYLTLDQSYEEVPSFRAVSERYDENFFEEKALVLIYIQSSDSVRRYRIHGVISGSNQLLVRVKSYKGGQQNRTGLSGWFISMAVPHSMLSGVTSFDADLDGAETMSVPWLIPDAGSEQGNSVLQAGLPATDFAWLSEKAKDAVAAEWDAHDSMSAWERQLSSHLFGCVYLSSESWEQLQTDVGIPLEDPLGKISWLKPTDIYGGISTDPDTPHIKTTLLALESMKRQVGQLQVTAGYKTDGVRVILGVTQWNTGGIYETLLTEEGDAEAYTGRVVTGTGVPVCLTAGNGTADYCDLTAWWTQERALYSLRVVGERETDVHSTMEKLLAEM